MKDQYNIITKAHVEQDIYAERKHALAKARQVRLNRIHDNRLRIAMYVVMVLVCIALVSVTVVATSTGNLHSAPTIDALAQETTVSATSIAPTHTSTTSIATTTHSTSTTTVQHAYSNDTMLIARVITGEASGQSYEGKLAVATVIMNRLSLHHYGHSIEAVVYKHGAFDCTTSTALWSRTPSIQDLAIAQSVIDGIRSSSIPAYTCFYYNPSVCDGTPGITYTTTIGDHVFGHDPIDK